MGMQDGIYHSTFCAEHKDDLVAITAWSAAYAQYLSESPERPGWCQKKADDDWQKFVE